MEAASPPRCKPRPPLPPEPVDSLPPEILQQVLSYLPLRDAVRTSAVSRAWRRLWESAPGLALEWPPGTDAAVAEGVLARYSGPVRSFKFDLDFHQGSFWRADYWVPLLAAKGVQILNLHFRGDWRVGFARMDASIFSCRELTSLDLTGACDILAAPPGLTGFPKLTRLCLRGVTFRNNGVRGLEALIAESPMLEIENFPSIEEVDIMVHNYPEDRDFVKLLTRLARVRKLRLMMPLTEDNVLEGLSCSLDNLKDLSLHTNYCSLPTILCKLCLLKNTPNLETLQFQIKFPNHEEAEVGVDLLNAQWIEGLLGNLKTFTIYPASWQPNEMHLIEFVLSKAPRLQELRVVAVHDCPKSKEEILEDITRYRKGSPKALGQSHIACKYLLLQDV